MKLWIRPNLDLGVPQLAQILVVLGVFLGPPVVFVATRGFRDTRKAGHTCTWHLHWAFFGGGGRGFRAVFREQNGCFWPQT